MVGVVLAITIILVLKKSSPDGGVSEASPLDITTESDSVPEDGDETVVEEVMLAETATAETKIESTEETTVLAKKDDAKKGYLNRCVFLGDSRTVAMVNYGFFNDDSALAQIGISHPSFSNNTFINNAGKEYTLKSSVTKFFKEGIL